MASETYRLEVESLDLGPEVRAVGLELIDTETREPVLGAAAARAWAAVVSAIAADEPWTIDFFAHIDRVREFCEIHQIAFRSPNSRVLMVQQPSLERAEALFERFAGETFGVRAGAPAVSADETVEGALAQRGVDGYRTVYSRYSFCAVCDFEDGFLTLLSEKLWASEVIRRTRGALTQLQIEVARPA